MSRSKIFICIPSFRIPWRPYFVAKATLKSSTWHWTSHTACRWLRTPSVWLRAKKDSRLTTDSYKELFMIKVSVKRKSSRTHAYTSPWRLSTFACLPPYLLGTGDGQRFRPRYMPRFGALALRQQGPLDSRTKARTSTRFDCPFLAKVHL